MRSTNYVLTLALLLGCGGGQSTDSTTPVMTEPPAEEPVAGEEQPTEPEKPAEPPAPPQPGDPAQVGPDIYKVVTENDQVRAFEVTFAAGAKIGLHKHPDHVFYALTPGKLAVTPQDGSAVQEIEMTAGQAGFMPAGAHSAENKTDKEIKALVVELRAASKSPAPKGKDPLKASKLHKKVFENEKVRVLEVTFKKGAKAPDHVHPDHWNYVIEGGTMEVTMPGAEGAKDKKKFDLTAGQGVFFPAGMHAGKNIGKTPVRIVIFELKPEGGAAPAEPAKPEPKPSK